MEFGLSSDLDDSRLFNGVYGDNEPWGSMNKMDTDDLTRFLDMDSNFSADDFMLPDDLELPMLQDDFLPCALVDPLDDPHSSDSSDSGIDFSQVKNEPLSPTSSHCSSDFSVESAHSGHSQSEYPIIIQDSAHSNQQPIGVQQNQITLASNVDGITVIKQEIPDLTNIPGYPNVTTLSSILPTQTNILTAAPNGGISVVKIEGPAPLTPPLTPKIENGILKPGTVVPSGAVPVKVTSGNIVKVYMPGHNQNAATVSNVIPTTMVTQSRMTTKPMAPLQPKQGTTGASKTLVLTQEEFAKLTSQKLLNIKGGTAALKPVVAMTTATPTASFPKAPIPVINAVKPNLACLPQTDSDMKTVKRQQRMMKNRESACLSRKRKKEYMSQLEDRLKEINDDNQKLKQENSTLRKTVNILQSENEQLKKGLPSSIMKGTTVLLGVMLLFSLNLGPFMGFLNGPTLPDTLDAGLRGQVPASSVHHGRTLMAYDYDYSSSDWELRDINNLDKEWNRLKKSLHLRREDSSSDRESTDLRLETGLMLAKQLETLTGPSVCPTYFNSTESQRLLNELRGWVRGHEEVQKREHEQKLKVKVKEENKKQDRDRNSNKNRKKYLSPRKLKVTAPGSEIQQFRNGNSAAGSDIQVYGGVPSQEYYDFFKSLERRNDTFYVVSFRRDHLLLPATAHNKTMRPRMSVVMPAMGINETMSPPAGSIAMMQIDCEVTATKLVHIDKSAVPEHLDPNITKPHDGHNKPEGYYGDQDDYLYKSQRSHPGSG